MLLWDYLPWKPGQRSAMGLFGVSWRITSSYFNPKTGRLSWDLCPVDLFTPNVTENWSNWPKIIAMWLINSSCPLYRAKSISFEVDQFPSNCFSEIQSIERNLIQGLIFCFKLVWPPPKKILFMSNFSWPRLNSIWVYFRLQKSKTTGCSFDLNFLSLLQSMDLKVFTWSKSPYTH